MRIRQPYLVAALVAIVAPSIGAQQAGAIRGIDGARLPLGRDSLAVYLIRGSDTARTGVVFDEVARVNGPDGALLVRSYRSQDRLLGDRGDSIVDRFPDIRPVRSRSWSARTAEALDFGGGRVSGWVRLLSGDSVTIATALAPDVINASSFDLVLRAAPLDSGWSGEVPAFDVDSRSVITLTARVVGVESVAGAPCWKVSAIFGALPVTFWIDQRNRRLRRQSMQVGPGMALLFTAEPIAHRTGRSS